MDGINNNSIPIGQISSQANRQTDASMLNDLLDISSNDMQIDNQDNFDAETILIDVSTSLTPIFSTDCPEVNELAKCFSGDNAKETIMLGLNTISQIFHVEAS
jgi:hypothetical protein